MSQKSQQKGRNKNLHQSTMGQFLSKKSSSNSEESSHKRRRVKGAGMFSSAWTRGSQRDTEEYRAGYPGKRDHPNYDDNLLFYTNKLKSRPDGDLVEDIHKNWWGDYSRLERHHGYIQWLFPIRDTGMNWQAQELQLHEAQAIQADKRAKKRVLTSYEMMLDFYGMNLKDEKTGKIERADNWRSRFQHLNRSYHNYLRITRILKSLGELGYEHLKGEFVRFILYEAVKMETLDNLLDSCVKFWIGVLKDDDERSAVFDYYENLYEEVENEAEQSKPSGVGQHKNSLPRLNIPQKSNGGEEEDDHDTLDYDMSLVDSDPNTPVSAGSGRAGRQAHDMSDSDDQDGSDFKTPEESQEMLHWNEETRTGGGSLQQDGHSQDAMDLPETSESNGGVGTQPEDGKKEDEKDWEDELGSGDADEMDATDNTVDSKDTVNQDKGENCVSDIGESTGPTQSSEVGTSHSDDSPGKSSEPGKTIPAAVLEQDPEVKNSDSKLPEHTDAGSENMES